MGTKLSPCGVRAYSTRGGTSPKSVRVRKPSATSSLSCLERVDSDMFPMAAPELPEMPHVFKGDIEENLDLPFSADHALDGGDGLAALHLLAPPSPARANPFGLKALHLRKIASLVRAYFPQCKSIGCFSRVTDVAAKTDEELAELAAAGFDGLTIGSRPVTRRPLRSWTRATGPRTSRNSVHGSMLRGSPTHSSTWWVSRGAGAVCGGAGDGGCLQPDEPLAHRCEYAHHIP